LLKKLLKTLAVAALALLPRDAGASNAIDNTPTVKIGWGMTSIPVKVWFKGDADSDATLRIFYGPNTDSGMTMIRRPSPISSHDGWIYEGRILWLTPGQTVSMRVKYDDPDGGSGTTTPQNVTTTTVRGRGANGTIYVYQNAAGAADANDGSSPVFISGTTGPKKTIGSGLTALYAKANQGDGWNIRIGPGRYRESLTLTGNTDGRLRCMEGDPAYPDSVIITAECDLARNGFSSLGVPWAWTFTGIDSIYKSPVSFGDSIGSVILDRTEWLNCKRAAGANQSMKNLTNDWNSAGVAGNDKGEVGGWCVSDAGDTLYIQRRTGGTPAGHTIICSYPVSGTNGSLIIVKQRNWRFANLTFAYAGYAATPNAAPGTNGLGLWFGQGGTDAAGCIVDSCKFICNESTAITQDNSADSLIIVNSRVEGNDIGDMGYGASKGLTEELTNIWTLNGGYNIVYNNNYTGQFNGPQLGGVGGAGADTTGGSGTEFSYNSITHCPDDGLEFDTGQHINTLAYKNTIRTSRAMSLAPLIRGPAFIFYNLCIGWGTTGLGGVKIGGTTTGSSYWYHNTLTGSNFYAAIKDAGGGQASYAHFRNNIIIGAGAVPGYAVSMVTGITDVTTNDMNYNMLDTTATCVRLEKWNATSYSVHNFGQAPLSTGVEGLLGWEKNGVRGHAAFLDSSMAVLNFRLTGLSAARDMGMRITGVNTGIGGSRYTVAPDAGAIEYNWPRTRLWFRRHHY